MAQDENTSYMEKFFAQEHFQRRVLTSLCSITVVLFCLSVLVFSPIFEPIAHWSAWFFPGGIVPLLKDSILHYKFLEHIFPHVFAVSLELLLAVWLIELVWRNHEKLRETEMRLTQLRLIKSQMFQNDMLELFRVNFEALADSVTVKDDKLSLDYLCKLCATTNAAPLIEVENCLTDQENCETATGKANKRVVNIKFVKYQSGDLAKVFMLYIKGNKNIWGRFLDMAIIMNIEYIVKDMTEIQSCIAAVKRTAARNHESPEEFLKSLFAENKVALSSDPSNGQTECYNQKLKQRIHRIAATGILKYVQFVCELKKEKDTASIERLKEACDNYRAQQSEPESTEARKLAPLEAKKLTQLELENKQLRRMYKRLMLENEALQDAVKHTPAS